ncbi:MAG: TIGR00730 family Rossman fold protein [Pseudorhodoplanes sp.]
MSPKKKSPKNPFPGNPIRSVCVYCGSGPGSDPAFVAGAEQFGRILAENGVRLVYGGGSIGLMGAIASAVTTAGGQVTGIIPDFLTGRERPAADVQELIVTRDMHERKRLMFERADAFVALPGGIGTLEELIEQLTWAQLGQHKKPILIANISGFWDPLRVLLDHMTTLRFIRPNLPVDLLVADRVTDILPMLEKAARAVSVTDALMDSNAAAKM